MDPSNGTDSCQFASLLCSYRSGCGNTLQSFLVECSDLTANRTDQCSEGCKNTLVGLTSTKEGKKLMEVQKQSCHSFFHVFYFKIFQCDCGIDSTCLSSRTAVAACKESVMRANQQGAVVSCAEARYTI